VFFFLFAGALAPAGAAHALWDDRLEPYASHAAYRDDNVLRLPLELSALLGQVLGTVPARSERVSAAGLAAGYRPHPRITLSLGLRRETRSTSLAFGAYTVNVASLGARIGF
jgi:hypothetical protein